MPYLKPERPEKVSAPSLKASKQRGERLVCLTAYDYPTARIVDEAGIDIILVGDSLGNVVLGYGNTVPVTLDEILIHRKPYEERSSEPCSWLTCPTEHFTLARTTPYVTLYVL